VLAVPEFAWVELEWDFQRELWEEFQAEFGFHRGHKPADWPAIQEPTPSLTWDMSSIYQAGSGFVEAARPVAQLVCDVLRECTEYWDSVIWHDGVHPSAQYRPHRVTDVGDLEGWEFSHYPNGDYSIFVSKDFSFGTLGNHFEKSLCFFGSPVVEAMNKLNAGLLTRMLRRDTRRIAE
jgi:hypothetical protein